MSKTKKEKTPMEKLTAGYSKLIKGKQLNNNNKELFDKVLKKAVKPRSSK